MAKVEDYWQSGRFRNLGMRQYEYMIFVKARRWARKVMDEINGRDDAGRKSSAERRRVSRRNRNR